MQGLHSQTSRISRGSDILSGLAAGDPLLRAAPLRAVEFVTPMHGSTSPALLRCSDGRYYVVKSKGRCRGWRGLANEMLAGLLGASLGLPMPGPVLVSVPFVLLEGPFRPRAGVRDAADPADILCLGSPYAETSRGGLVVDFLPEKLLGRVANLAPAFLGAYVLDAWMDNCGCRKAVFVRAGTTDGAAYSALLINHDECFNRGQWALKDFRMPCLYPAPLVYEAALGVDSLEPFLSRIEGLQAGHMERCARAVPQAWCGQNPEEIFDLADCLLHRRLRLRQAVFDLLKQRSWLPPLPTAGVGL